VPVLPQDYEVTPDAIPPPRGSKRKRDEDDEEYCDDEMIK